MSVKKKISVGGYLQIYIDVYRGVVLSNNVYIHKKNYGAVL